jgi:hypothetical protein
MMRQQEHRRIMQLRIGDRYVVTWDADDHPGWPPFDENGKLIADVPWKFFDPPRKQTRLGG